MASSKRLSKLLREVKPLAREYYELTGRPLGVTAEIAEYEAARLLRLKLSRVRQSGYDAIRATPHGDRLLQIKGRYVPTGSISGQRIGSINLQKEWDAVVLVLLDQNYSPTALYEADRPELTDALTAPGSRARNDRGQLSVSKFVAIGRKIWPH